MRWQGLLDRLVPGQILGWTNLLGQKYAGQIREPQMRHILGLNFKNIAEHWAKIFCGNWLNSDIHGVKHGVKQFTHESCNLDMFLKKQRNHHDVSYVVYLYEYQISLGVFFQDLQRIFMLSTMNSMNTGILQKC